MATIVTLTLNPALDVATSVENVVSGVKLRCGRPRYDPGGGGINVARAIHELGGDALAVYASGGTAGARIERMLADEGVEQLAIEIAGETRESLAVTDRHEGDQYRFLLPGPELSESEWQACIDTVVDRVDDGGWVVASGSLAAGVPADFFARLIRRLAGGVHIVLDTSGPALLPALAEGVDVLNPNWRELAEIASGTGESEFAAKLVREGRARAVVVTLGARGARLTTSDGQILLRAPEVEPVSPVGGGDCFTGALTLALSRGETYLEATRQGVAAAAAAMLTPGTALCRRRDFDRMLAEVEVPRPALQAG
jgi:6-phosphofructokinase 2